MWEFEHEKVEADIQRMRLRPDWSYMYTALVHVRPLLCATVNRVRLDRHFSLSALSKKEYHYLQLALVSDHYSTSDIYLNKIEEPNCNQVCLTFLQRFSIPD